MQPLRVVREILEKLGDIGNYGSGGQFSHHSQKQVLIILKVVVWQLTAHDKINCSNKGRRASILAMVI